MRDFELTTTVKRLWRVGELTKIEFDLDRYEEARNGYNSCVLQFLKKFKYY